MAETVGQVLRAAREATGRSVVELARVTRIPVGSLVALEENNFAALPASVFVRGFIRSYAREIRLDPPDVLGLYDAYLHETTLRTPAESDEPVLAPLLYASGTAEVQRDSFRGLQVSHVLLLALAAITLVIAYVTAGVPSEKSLGSSANRDDSRGSNIAGTHTDVQDGVAGLGSPEGARAARSAESNAIAARPAALRPSVSPPAGARPPIPAAPR